MALPTRAFRIGSHRMPCARGFLPSCSTLQPCVRSGAKWGVSAFPAPSSWEEGLKVVTGAGGVDGNMAGFEAALGLSAIHRAQVALLSDMDEIADALYGRKAKEAVKAAPKELLTVA